MFPSRVIVLTDYSKMECETGAGSSVISLIYVNPTDLAYSRHGIYGLIKKAINLLPNGVSDVNGPLTICVKRP